MQDSDLKRHLSAILAADVAGYSKLMAGDERATVMALDAARQIFRTQIESNQGRVVDMVGDAVLAQFTTAVGALVAAQSIQTEINRIASTAPPDRAMRFRIGIHLGDVIEKPDGTLYGDGVNIAARLESIADFGGITVSSMIHEVVRNRVEVNFVEQGEFEVKNIPYPVKAYRILIDGSLASGAKPKASADGNIDAILGQRDHLEKLIQEKFKRRLAVVSTSFDIAAASTGSPSDLDALEAIKRYQEIVSKTVTSMDGTIVKMVGHDTLSHFSDTQNALRAAVKIQQAIDESNMLRTESEPVLVRIGLTSGECFLEKDDIFGDVVSMAVVIRDAAHPGEILLTEETFLSLSDKSEIYCRHYAAIPVRGKEGRVNAHKAFWDHDEAEKDQLPVDQQRPVEQEGPWKKWALIAIPLVVALTVIYLIAVPGKDNQETRSITQTLPSR